MRMDFQEALEALGLTLDDSEMQKRHIQLNSSEKFSWKLLNFNSLFARFPLYCYYLEWSWREKGMKTLKRVETQQNLNSGFIKIC